MKAVSAVLLSDISPLVPLWCIKPQFSRLGDLLWKFIIHLLERNALTKYHVLVAKIMSIHCLKGSPMPVKTCYILAVLTRGNYPLGSHALWEEDLGSTEK